MSFLGSISNFFGGSSKHAENAVTHLSNAKDDLHSATTSVYNGLSGFFAKTAGLTAFTAWCNYESVAGKILGLNAAVNGAGWFSGLFYTPAQPTLFAKAVGWAAQSLVSYPVGSMAAIMAGTTMAAHPFETLNAVKEAGKAAFNVVKAGLNTAAAVAEAGLALGLGIIEVADKVFTGQEEAIESALKQEAADKVQHDAIELDTLHMVEDTEVAGEAAHADTDSAVAA